MPRDSAGNMTLAKPPFVQDTASSAPDMNADLDDIKTELTDSLSRTGKGGLLAPLRFSDGTLAIPSISFTSETGSGFYRVAANVLAWVIAGVERIRATATGAKVTGTFEVTSTSTLTGLSKHTAGIITGSATGVLQAGDLGLQRSGAPTTGNITFGNTANHNLYHDGTQLWVGDGTDSNRDAVTIGAPTSANHAATKGYVDGHFKVAGLVANNGSTASITQQVGPITASVTRAAQGNVTVTVAGLTTSAIIQVTAIGTNTYASWLSGTGSFSAYTTNSAGTNVDIGFSFEVIAL